MSGARMLATCLVGVVLILALMQGCASVTAGMSEGERLYRANCASCHRLIRPEEHEAVLWRHYVDEYGSKLDEEKKRRILEFLAGAEPSARSYPSQPAANENGP